jgi:MFS transporter, DHA1 family, tetracycline resistance protein
MTRSQAEPAASRQRSPLLPIFLIVLVDVLGLTIILPLLPFYAERLSASPTVVGLLVSTYAACQLLSGPLLGQLSDRVGRRPVLLVSQAGTFIGFLVLAWAGHAGRLWMVFLSRVIDGVTAGNLSLAQAYISDVTRPDERAKSFGLIGVAFGVGFFIGPAVSGLLSTFSYVYPVIAAAALSFTSIMATYFLLPSVPPPPPLEAGDGPQPRGTRLTRALDWGAYVTYFRRPALARRLWQFLAFGFAFATFTSGFALFAERRYTWNGRPFGPREIGYIFAYVGLLGIILQGTLIGRLVKRFGEEALVALGFVTATIGFASIEFTYRTPGLLIAAGLTAVGTGVLRPTLTSVITQHVGRHEQGVVLGLTQSLMSSAQIVAPVIAGFLIDRALLTTWAAVGAAAAAVGILIGAVRSRGQGTTS